MKKKNNYWTKDLCLFESLKFENRTDFHKKACGAYKSALRNNWLDDICGHMLEKGSLYKRYNYIYEFSDNFVYIGLTCDINRRNYEHLNNEKSPVFKRILSSNITPKLIFDSLKPIDEAKKIEIETIIKYKKNGWFLLNKNKGGGTGKTNSKWTIDKAKNESLKFKTRLEFQKKSHTCYKFCLKNNIMDIVCLHMIKKGKINIKTNKWDKEKCFNEALKYNTKKDFYTNSENAYRYSLRNNFLNEICSHMVKKM
jgi:predicted GIY-YIG superfamily endonuclease